MSFFKTKWARVLLIVLTTSLAQCSKEDADTKNIDITVISEAPLIHRVDRDLGDTTIEANWFSMTLKLANASANRLRVEEILFYVSVDGVEGDPMSFDLGSLEWTDIITGDVHSYINYCNYPPGTAALEVEACSTPNGLTTDADSIVANMYIGGIPDPKDATNYVYNVRMVLLGMFLDPVSFVELKRFEKTIYFTTR